MAQPRPFPFPFRSAVASAALLCVAGGCAAYNKTMGAVMKHSTVIEGHVKAVNTMAVPVCKITLSPHGGEPRDKDDLNGDVLGPGKSANVDIPTIGDPMDVEAPQPETWDIQVYACEHDIHGDAEPGDVLASYTEMPIEKDGTLTIR